MIELGLKHGDRGLNFIGDRLHMKGGVCTFIGVRCVLVWVGVTFNCVWVTFICVGVRVAFKWVS